jgi:hypothetical protein
MMIFISGLGGRREFQAIHGARQIDVGYDESEKYELVPRGVPIAVTKKT